MTKKSLRTCCVCHRDFSFCPVCNPEDRNKPTWYFAYCSENCKDIYSVASDYENGNIQADEAKVKLDKLDLSKIANFGESYQKAIMKINENATPVEKTDDTTKEIESVVDENTDISTNKYYRKSKVKKVKDDGDIE